MYTTTTLPPFFSPGDEDDEGAPWNAIPQDPNNFHPRGNQSNPIKFKLEMAPFDGYMHMEDFLDRLDRVEDYFDCMGVEDHLKVRLVTYKLKGGARAWWKQLQHSRFLEGQDPVISWLRMRQLLRNRFLPTNFSQTLYLQCLNYKQGTRSIKEYT